MNQFSMNRKIVGPIHPPHLPQPLADPLAYERLYEFNHGVDDHCMVQGDWFEKGVRPQLPERPEGCFAQLGSDPFFLQFRLRS